MSVNFSSKIQAGFYLKLPSYRGEPAPDISNASVYGSPFSGMIRANPKSKIFTVLKKMKTVRYFVKSSLEFLGKIVLLTITSYYYDLEVR